ncbi:2-hydroxychromene-2-carboxylate isomerase [Oceanospirillum beijerinckii]|uniref:2-hydroxychromene-2-carboxylate isomerase n=1 Tax=Oceanospirillum beijerinckii TaxID=64976 RepID=UPI0004044101|nr:2-hydroxychromene-2-carboxylate isomerase [Oceanospirillum beijerinckii]
MSQNTDNKSTDNKSIDFYYDYISPASYLAWTQLAGICERTGATINYKPMLLGGVFKQQGTNSPITIPAKWQWMQKDFARYAAHYGVPYQLNPHFVFSTVGAMRGAIWAQQQGRVEDYNQAMYTAAWVDGKDLSSPEVLAEVLTDAGFNTEVMDAVTQPEIKQALIQACEDAVAQGVFGAPTMIVNGELFFGQDRLEWVERALK